ncbi:hypothetical protein ACFO9Q_04945 [Paenibacillus sp. GCM10023252]|uniref:hypothetical protein n=1 Tax=Paenibacillus sp. GCM10023252 TaxID=3252649 RepID=UPI003613ED31
MINKLSVVDSNSKFVKGTHPIILVDGNPLDSILNEIYPDDLILGLIPTIVDWMSIDEESKLIQNVYQAADDKKILPILMCPDDCDISCTLIVAEVETTNNQVNWNRIGIDMNNSKDLIEQNEFIDSKIKWLDRVPQMTFSKEDYRLLDRIYKTSKIE